MNPALPVPPRGRFRYCSAIGIGSLINPVRILPILKIILL